MKHVNPPTNPKRVLYVLIGLAFIAGGLFLMAEFLLKFLKFVVGLVCLTMGIQFLWRR
jgi:hypothetical protein